MPHNTNLLEAHSVSMNTGNGNNIELWTAILIESGLTENELAAHFSNYMIIEITGQSRLEVIYNQLLKHFERLNTSDEYEGLFIIHTFVDTVTPFDIRGH